MTASVATCIGAEMTRRILILDEDDALARLQERLAPGGLPVQRVAGGTAAFEVVDNGALTSSS